MKKFVLKTKTSYEDQKNCNINSLDQDKTVNLWEKSRVFGVYLPLLFLVRTCLCVSNYGRKRTRASGGVSVNDRSGDGHSDSEAREDLAEV